MAAESTISFTGSGFVDPDVELPDGVILQNINNSPGAFVVTSTEETIVGLGLSDSPTSPIASSIRVNANVDDLQADLGAGDDRLRIGGDMANSSVELGSGNDNLVVTGNVTDSGITSDTGADVLTFNGSVTDTYIDAGADDDLVTFFGDVNGSVVNLGTGIDVVRFYGDVTSTQLDLGSDGQVDTIDIDSSTADTTGLVIEGAGAEDILFIGSSQYSYQGNYTWQNIDNPLDEKIFGP